MHDGACRRVLHVHFLAGFDLCLDSECSKRRFVKTAQYQFLFARVVVDVADCVNPGLRRLEFFGIDIDRLAIDVQSPFGDWTKLGGQAEEDQYVINCYVDRVTLFRFES